jgi:hypothetical protein
MLPRSPGPEGTTTFIRTDLCFVILLVMAHRARADVGFLILRRVIHYNRFSTHLTVREGTVGRCAGRARRDCPATGRKSAPRKSVNAAISFSTFMYMIGTKA